MNSRFFAVEGPIQGFSEGGNPVVSKSDIHVVKAAAPGIKYVRIEGPDSNRNKSASTSGKVKKQNNKNSSSRSTPYQKSTNEKKKRNGWKILNDAVAARRKKEERRGNEWDLPMSERTLLWDRLKTQINEEGIKATVSFITGAVNEY